MALPIVCKTPISPEDSERFQNMLDHVLHKICGGDYVKMVKWITDETLRPEMGDEQIITFWYEIWVTAWGYQWYLNADHWSQVRREALERADYACQVCNDKRDLQVHHRTYERLGCERPADVTVLCDRCHAKHHGKMPKKPE